MGNTITTIKKEIVYLYSQSYYGIFISLHLMNKGQKVIIITSSNNLIKAAKLLKINTIKINKFTPKNYLLKPGIINSEIQKLVDLVKNSQFHFSHRQYDAFCFVLIKKLISKKQSVFFHPIEYIYYDTPGFLYKIKLLRKTLRFLLLKYALFFYWAVRCDLKYKGNNILLSLNNNSLLHKNIIEYKYEKEFEQVKLDLVLKYQIKNTSYNNLFISQNLYSLPIIKYDSIKKLYLLLKDLEINIKEHPNEKLKVENYQKIDYPAYIPVELLFGNVKNAVVSVYSLALVSASYFKNLKSISLLNLIEWNDLNFKNEMKIFLQQESKNKIYFPETIQEFISLLKLEL